MHLSERLAVDAGIGHKDALRHQRLILLLKVDVELRADESHNGLLVGFSTDDEHLVAQMEHGVAIRNRQLALMHKTGNHEVTVQEVVHL